MTNKDKLNQMSTWELAEFLYKVSNNDTKITNCTSLCGKCKMSDAYCISGIGEWLNRGCESENH